MRTCVVCGSPMKEITTSIEAGWGKYDLLIKGVKAWRCEGCGEEEYDSKEIELVETLSRAYSECAERPDVLNVEEVADLLRVSKQTAYNLIKSGKLPATKVGREWRFYREAVLACLGNTSEQAASRASSSRTIAVAARLTPGTEGLSEENARIIEKHLKRIKSEASV